MTSEADAAGRQPWWVDYFDEDFLRIYRNVVPEEEAGRAAAAIVELVELEAGARVLDVACGWGRHSVKLATLGMRVVGLDRSELLLRRAVESAPGENVAWVRADMREIPFAGAFDVALSLFSSLGYFLSDREDLRALRSMREALRPGGCLVLETVHRDAVVRDYAERDWWWGEGGELVWVERQFDPFRGVTRETLRWLRPDGTMGEKHHRARVRTATEWNRLLRRAGLRPEGWFGGWAFEPFDHRSDMLVVLARRVD